jgi:hypothetical protein
MLGALLAGEGLRGVAALAAAEADQPVAIVLPARGLDISSAEEFDLVELTAFAAARAHDASASVPDSVAAVAPVIAGGERIGLVLGLRPERNGFPGVAVDREEVLRTAGLAALTEVAVADARDELAGEVRGTLLEDLRGDRADGDDIVRRAARLGCDLRRGAMALVAEVRSARPQHAAALISGSTRRRSRSRCRRAPRRRGRRRGSTPSCRRAEQTTRPSARRPPRAHSRGAFGPTGRRRSRPSTRTRPISAGRSPRPS